MSRTFRLVLATHLILALFTTGARAVTGPPHLWSRGFGGTNTLNADGSYGVAVDPLRNVIVVGQFDGTTNFGGADLTALAVDIFIAKYSPTGVHLWSKRFGSVAGPDIAYAVTTDAFGNIYVTGNFTGTVDFGNGVGLVSAGQQDAFLAKYAPNGTTLWARRMGDVSLDTAFAVAMDPTSTSPVVAGFYIGGAGWGGAALTAFGAQDLVIAKYDGNSGAHVWSKGVGGTGTDIATGIACDLSGNVYATGYFQNSLNFGGGILTSAGSDDIFLVKYNSAGTHVSSVRYGSTGSDQGNGVATDAAGNVVVTGVFSNTVNFGGSGLVSSGATDIFLAKYNSGGTHQWSFRYGDSGGDIGFGVACDGPGNVALTGLTSGNIDFGGGFLFGTGGSDIYVAKLNSSGGHIWSRRIGAPLIADDGRAVAIDALGNVAAAGRFQGTIDFGGGPILSNGFYEAYIVKYGTRGPAPAITSIADIGNDQGRKVKIKFAGSGGDNADAATPITTYEAYRRSDAPPPAMVAGADAFKHATSPEGMSPSELLLGGWTFAGSVPAHQETNYSIDAPTIGDSTVALGQYYSVFFIRAASGQINTFYDSPPDSGWSKDNLAPGAPQNLIYTAGNLAWNESTAKDFDYFTVYGSNVDNFAGATLVDYTISNGLNVNASPYVYYYVTATDFSGNEGKPAKVNSLSGVGGTPQRYVLSVSNYPNPFNPRTTVKYTVPSRGIVDVNVYDASGAHVAALFHGERGAGAYSIDWNGRGENGESVGSGIYFARITHNGATHSRKMVLLK